MSINYKVQLNNISQTVKNKRKKKTILANLDLTVNKGEFIAIVGCSGAGKTTLMNILGGYNKPSSGNIYIDGIDFFANEEYFKGKIAYVPQLEILDQTLTLQKSLEYSYRLRVKQFTKAKMQKDIENILNLLELTSVKNNLIKNLSGGEKKRASIATEMLSNPDLFLLDEPTSGLDANIEKKIMKKLREIASTGKTVIITAHTIANLNLCDKVLFMGQGGKICYYGSYNEICSYFKVKEFVDIYDLLKNDTDLWHKKYLMNLKKAPAQKKLAKVEQPNKKVGFITQTSVLVKRYISSLVNNKLMFSLLLGQSILMGLLICMAIEKKSLLNPAMASMLGVVLTLASTWLGLFNTIQEIVKEKDILKKEYISGLSFSAYIFSKIIVFFLLCLYQAFTCVTLIYFYLDPRPTDNLITITYLDLVINFFLVALSTSTIGLFISAIVKHIKTTLIIAPLYMMIQMIFSGMFIPFTNFTKKVSYLIVSRYSYEATSTISNILQYGVVEPLDNFFKFSADHVLKIWAVLILVFMIFLIASIVIIRNRILTKK